MTAVVSQPPGRVLPAESLIEAYAAREQFLFVSPQSSLLAAGVAVDIPAAPDGLDLGEYALNRLRTTDHVALPPIVVGALPFRRDRPANLVVPRQLRRGGPLGSVGGPTDPAARLMLRAVPERADYRSAVRASSS
ncbi:MAG: hypothetical protein QM650_18260 [Microlunatus sp.]